MGSDSDLPIMSKAAEMLAVSDDEILKKVFRRNVKNILT